MRDYKPACLFHPDVRKVKGIRKDDQSHANCDQEDLVDNVLQTNPGILPEIPLSEQRDHADARSKQGVNGKADTFVLENYADGED